MLPFELFSILLPHVVSEVSFIDASFVVEPSPVSFLVHSSFGLSWDSSELTRSALITLFCSSIDNEFNVSIFSVIIACVVLLSDD